MEFRGYGEQKSFLGCLGEPFEQCCCCCWNLTLKQGVFIIAIIDGVFLIREIAQSVGLFAVLSVYGVVEVLPPLILNLYYIAVSIGAIFGILGMIKLRLDWMKAYYILKVMTVPVVVLDMLLAILVNEELRDSDERLGLVIGSVLEIILVLIESKVLWSAIERVSNNEATLVIHGKDASGIMQHQARNLEMVPGGYIQPGQPIQ